MATPTPTNVRSSLLGQGVLGWTPLAYGYRAWATVAGEATVTLVADSAEVVLTADTATVTLEVAT